MIGVVKIIMWIVWMIVSFVISTAGFTAANIAKYSIVGAGSSSMFYQYGMMVLAYATNFLYIIFHSIFGLKSIADITAAWVL